MPDARTDREALFEEADRVIREAQERAAALVEEQLGPSPADLLRAWEAGRAGAEAADIPAKRAGET